MSVLLATYRRHGFARIETPALERLELLQGGQAGENEKLIYRVLKRGSKLDLSRPDLSPEDLADLGLRFDLTVPLARYYAHHHARLPTPFQAIQVGPVWRAERPQRGRWRQFTQCDIDVLGEAGPVAELSLILATIEVLTTLGLSGFTLRLNDRRVLQALVQHCGFDPQQGGAVCIALDKLDKIGADGVRAQLLGQGHAPAAVDRLAQLVAMPSASLESLRGVLELPGEILDELAALAEAVGSALGERGQVRFDPSLARGMGYYTGPVFEVEVAGLPFSLAGGGRYDDLVGRVLGRDVPACGFSIGFERLLLVLAERGLQPGRERRRVALLYERNGVPLAGLAQAARGLRQAGHDVALVPRRARKGRQLDELAEHGFDAFSLFEDGAAAPPRPLART